MVPWVTTIDYSLCFAPLRLQLLPWKHLSEYIRRKTSPTYFLKIQSCQEISVRSQADYRDNKTETLVTMYNKEYRFFKINLKKSLFKWWMTIAPNRKKKKKRKKKRKRKNKLSLREESDLQSYHIIIFKISSYQQKITKDILGTALPGFRNCNTPWLRLSQNWDHKPLRRQSLSPW